MRRVLALSFALLSLAGCGGDGGSGPDPFLGRYTLRMINGDELPVTIVDEPGLMIEVTSGALTFDGDGSFTDRVSIRWEGDAGGGTESGTFGGTWERDGATVTLVYDDGSTIDVEVDGNTLLMPIDESLVLIYQK